MTEAAEGSGRKSAGRVHMRGTYVTFTEYWHGEGAVGIMSIADNRKAPGLTLIGGFDCELAARNVVTERHGIPIMLCDVSAIYADPNALRRADIVRVLDPRACEALSRLTSGATRSRMPTIL